MNYLFLATKPDIAVFGFATLFVIGGAVRVVTASSAVHGALGLVVSLFGIAMFFIQQEAHLLAAAQVIVYAGAIVVMFLFVIMFLGVDISTRQPFNRRGLIAGLVTLPLLFIGIMYLGGWNWNLIGEKTITGPTDVGSSGVGALSRDLFSRGALAFEATSLLLIAAVVGAIGLSRRLTDSGPEITSEEADKATSEKIFDKTFDNSEETTR